MIPSWAKVGSKIVMVDGSADLDGNTFTEGDIYIIKELKDFNVPAVKCHLIGVSATRLNWSRLSRYRPLVSESDDIAMFRKIASNLPTAKELEDSVQLALERLG